MKNAYDPIKDILAVLCLTLLTVLFFVDVLFLDRVFFSGDNLTINVPSKVLLLQYLKQGYAPLWNPFLFSGMPFLADINLGLLSPINILYLLCTPLKALSYTIVFQIYFAGIGMYAYMRKLGKTPLGSLLSAIVFMFSGTLMTHTMNTAILNTVVYLPLICFLLEYLFETDHIKYALFTSFALALCLFGGHIQYFYYISLFVLLYIAGIPDVSWKKKIIYSFAVFLPTVGLTAIQTLPFLELASLSTRPVQSLSYAGTTSLVSNIRLLLPTFFGVVKDGTSWGATADINGYVGIIPLILSIILILKQKNRFILFFALTAFISICLALGNHSPVYIVAFYIVPFFSRFRSPSGILILYTFSLAVLSGVGIEYFFQKIRSIKQVSVVKFILACFVGTSVVLMALRLAGFPLFVRCMTHLQQTTHSGWFNRFLEYSPLRMHIIFNLWIDAGMHAVIFIICFLYFAYISIKARCFYPVQKLLLVLIVALDLLLTANTIYVTSNEHTLKTQPAISHFIAKNRGNFRILTYMDPGAKPPFADPTFFEREAIKAMDFFQPNTNLFALVPIIDGYASMVPRSFSQYLSPHPNNIPTGVSIPPPEAGQIDELSVKYVITAGRFEEQLKSNKTYKQVFSFYDPRIKRTFTVFENMQVLPRSYVQTKDGIIETKILVYTPQSIKIQTNIPSKGRLVLTDPMYPGWTVTVDGKKKQITPYDIFRSVEIEKGKHEVIFQYQPVSVLAGRIISAVNWIYLGGFLLFLGLKKHKYIREEFHISEPKVKDNA